MKTLIVNANIIVGDGNLLENGYLVVEEGTITQVGTSFQDSLRPYQKVIDLSGRYVLPGLIDCHVHLTSDGGADPVAQLRADSEAMAAFRAAENARRTLQAGFTTVRDCGAKSEVVIALKSAIEQGMISGPRILASGRAMSMTGGHGWWAGREIDGPEEARKAARETLKAGADFLKFIATGGIMTEGVEVGSAQLDLEELAAGIREAKKAGKKTAAHAHGPEGVKNAIKAGIDSVEHGYLMDDEAISALANSRAFFVPTVTAVHLVVENGAEAGIPPYVVTKSQQAVKLQERSFKAAHAAGVRMALGTDAGMPFNRHGENHQELTRMVSLGLSPMEAIIAGTKAAAELLGLEKKIGTIEPGKLADLLVLDGNPLEDIARLQKKERIKLVIKGGRIILERD